MDKIIALVLLTLVTTMAYSHSGRTASDGCHNERSTGERHCH
ncbi:YHYH domain-containing protein [Acinetobacter sp. ANC 3781]|nr:YHYH domain-containing protein [Acinetobacter sp. ANC 3781]